MVAEVVLKKMPWPLGAHLGCLQVNPALVTSNRLTYLPTHEKIILLELETRFETTLILCPICYFPPRSSKQISQHVFEIYIKIEHGAGMRWWYSGQHCCIPSNRPGFDSRPMQRDMSTTIFGENSRLVHYILYFHSFLFLKIRLSCDMVKE